MALSSCSTTVGHNGQELIKHGTPLFPVACYHDDLLREPVPWHWHDELEAAIITEGQTVLCIDSEKYILSEGEGFFCNAGVLHAAQVKGNVTCRFHSIVFHPRLIGGSLDSIYWQSYIKPVLDDTGMKGIVFHPSDAHAKEAIDAIEGAWQSCVKETEGYEFEVRSFLSKLIFVLKQYHSPLLKPLPDKMLRNGNRIKIMLQYIQEHYEEELAVSQIAKSALISESECLRCFKNTISITPIQYVKQLRVQKAAEYLTATDYKIAEIGAMCGFSEMSYFAKTFRKMKGCTPSVYRQNHTETGNGTTYKRSCHIT
ncbi:MAG: helix-turn-helix transcriptional regulator [Lachnospiraceae bacterium]|nr:helix-turn-helix transcriptional regulator [Lachnospiraceae bacterium]